MLIIKNIQYDAGYIYVEFDHGAIAQLGLYAPPLPPITDKEFAEGALKQPDASYIIANQINHPHNNVQNAIKRYIENISNN